MNNKRFFLKSLLFTATMPFTLKANNLFKAMPESWTAEKYDDFWQQIRSDYKLKPDYINFENGWYSMLAQPVLEAYINDVRMINLEGSY